MIGWMSEVVDGEVNEWIVEIVSGCMSELMDE